MPANANYSPQQAHQKLGDEFFDKVKAAEFPATTLRYRDDRAAATVGLETLSDDEWLDHFACFTPLPDNFPTPLALRYHGHQFRHYNPDLGDGRGFLFAQLKEKDSNRLLDLGTKGSGRTPWSRAGDGKLTLKGGVREILASRMLEALGVDTSKSFSLVETHEELVRGDEPSPTRSAVLVRLSHSHIRIGTFQRLAHLEKTTHIARLVDHCITHYMPHCAHSDGTKQVLSFFEQVCESVATTGARWMQAGFVHGVLNTDNINITGESFDYGPWRFAPVCDPNLTAAYFDESGLYAFARQASTLLWNLTRLAECLTPFADNRALEKVLERYPAIYTSAFIDSLIERLGLVSRGREKDEQLTHAMWNFLESSQAPFEQVFFDWFGGVMRSPQAFEGPNSNFYKGTQFEEFKQLLSAYHPRSAGFSKSAYFNQDTPTTMLIDEVEAIWAPIARDDNWHLFENKLKSIDRMQEALSKVQINQAGEQSDQKCRTQPEIQQPGH